jgi:ATP-binding cassette subfamily B protein
MVSFSGQNRYMPDQKRPIQKEKDLGLLRRFFRYMKPYKVPLRNVYLLYLANSLLNLAPAFSLRYYFDMVVEPKAVTLFGIPIDTSSMIVTSQQKLLWSGVYFLLMILLILAANSVGVVMWRLGTKVTQNLLLDIKSHIIHHLHKLSLSYFQNEQTGSIMSRAVGDVMQMQQMLRQSFSLTYGCLHLVLAPILMLTMSPMLFLFSLVPLPVILYSIKRIRSRLRPLYRQQRERQAKVDAAVQEQISGIKEIKAFGQEDELREDIHRVNMEYRDSVNEAMKVFSVNHQLMYGTKDFAMVLMGVAGGMLITLQFGQVSLGMVLAFIPLMNHFFQPFNQLVGFYDVIQRGLASTERVFEFLDIQPDIQNKPGAEWVDLKDGRVRFENVTFGYQADRPVLHDLSFEVEPGTNVAIVGSTGSGKSTLVSLIPRFYDPQQGRICIDGHDISRVRMESIRKAIGIVFQDTFLFYGTIAQNISFSRPNAPFEQIVEAARLANIHEFIESLPDGYDSRIGERGVTLSGGQRQRVAIARMILKDPSIIVLDEATSALDATTEKLIQESLEHLMHGRTSFIIAHRLSTIRKANRILVLEDGKIIEAGSHEELLDHDGRYAELVATVS